jgi:serine/threonine protein kinase
MPGHKSIEFRTTFAVYRSTGVLGEGGAGTVYAAVDDADSPVAIKLLDPRKATPDRLKRFKNEYLFGFTNQHPNLLRVLDSGVLQRDKTPSPFFVARQYKGSLRPLMKIGITADTVLPLFARILDGVEAAHLLKVIHRDIKPENILANGIDDVVIGDFGIARFEEEELYTAVETKNTERLANFAYAAPEQRKRGGAVDHRADIFALGLLLNELFTSEVPQGTDFRTVGSVAPGFVWVDGVVAQMIRFDASSRPSSVAAVRELLRVHSDQFLTQQRISTLTKTVIKSDEIDDPLASEPPTIVGADYDGSVLIIKFDQPITEGWIDGLRNMGSYASAFGAGPEAFRFRGNEARVPSDGHNAQQILDHLKNWLPRATAVYRQRAQQSREAERRRQEEAFRREREELERRNRVRSQLNF